MAAMIKDRQVVNDNWLLVKSPDDSLPPGELIVPLALWLAQGDTLRDRGERLGVWLNSHEDPAQIADDLLSFSVIAVNFPRFTDGRGYSIAQLLRSRYGWRGELRAIGDIFRDQLYYLARCGFDAFVLRESEDPLAALAAFDDFSDSYQATADRPLPLFRRRLKQPPPALENGADSSHGH